MGGVQLKYATVQPICSLKEGNTRTFFFFEDDQIGGEYLLENKNIQDIKVNNGVCKADKNGYFINQLVPGTDCSIEITQKDGAKSSSGYTDRRRIRPTMERNNQRQRVCCTHRLILNL